MKIASKAVAAKKGTVSKRSPIDPSLGEIVLPGLRGHFGDWVYYSVLMTAGDLAKRVSYANDIHKNEALSKWIQRQLEGTRSNRISNYLEHSQQRFFNSLVLAVYDGEPKWIELGSIRFTANPALESLISESAAPLVGFLQLSGAEKLFAVDGQHRLAGMKKAVAAGIAISEETVPVILVAHKTTAAGMLRTRRLFTTLNKTAVPVVKKDIIALDEDDVMAITARALVENYPQFSPPKIALKTTQNIPASDQISFTTIGTLYDCLYLLFRHTTKQRRDSLRFNRPKDTVLKLREEEAVSYLNALGDAFPEVSRYFSSNRPEKLVPKLRNSDGGHILFRPIGLVMVTKLAIALSEFRGVDIFTSISLLSKLPTDISDAPYSDVVWDSRRKRIVGKGTKLCLDLLFYICRIPSDGANLREKYGEAVGQPIALPRRIMLPAK